MCEVGWSSYVCLLVVFYLFVYVCWVLLGAKAKAQGFGESGACGAGSGESCGKGLVVKGGSLAVEGRGRLSGYGGGSPPPVA